MKKNDTLKNDQDSIVNSILAGRSVDSAALRDAAKSNDEENHKRKVNNAKRVLSDVDGLLDNSTAEVKKLRQQLATAETKLASIAKVRARLAKGDISKLEEDVKVIVPEGTFDMHHHRERILTTLA